MTGDIHWHALPVGECFKRLNSKREGLTTKEVERRLATFGPNETRPETKVRWWRVLLRQFKSPLIFLLVLAAAFTVAFGVYSDTAVIIMAVLANTLIGFFYEYRASRTLQNLRRRQEFRAWVRRDGNWQEIDVRRLVPGDVFRLRPGDIVPADTRLLTVHDLSVDEAVLTGEANEVLKAAAQLAPATHLAERQNMVWAGTTVLDGTAEGLAVAAGEDTEFGKIKKVVRASPPPLTPFERKIVKLARFLTVVVGFIVLILSAVGLGQGNGVLTTLELAVAVAVSAIPEGLPIAVTVILAIGLTRILAKRGLVKRLAATEALGGTSVILTDKTGTLTRGEMSVGQVIVPSSRHGEFNLTKTAPGEDAYAALLKTAALAADVIIENPLEETEHWRIRGRPAERAIIKAAAAVGILLPRAEKEHPLLRSVPFTSARKFSVSYRRYKEKIVGFFLGAPEVLLDHVFSLNHSSKIEIKNTVDSLANTGYRVLAVGQDKNFIGLIGFADPVREDVPEVIRLTRSAGIRTVMVTGDHVLTARKVAKEIKLLPEGKTLATVMEGEELERISPEELARRIGSIDIFARVSPLDKVKIVSAWQRTGATVAMSGDGVNDAPALAQADVGIAVGTGTDIAKDTADIVLLDNSFRTIVAAVHEGRVILENLKKVITYLLADSFTEIALLAASFAAGWPLPVLASQILWVNLVEDSLPAIALAFDPAERDLMKRPPTAPQAPLIDKEMRFLILVVGLFTSVFLIGLFAFFLAGERSIDSVRTIVFTGLAINSLFYVFSLRSFHLPLWRIRFWENRQLLLAVAVGGLLVVAAVYLAPLQLLLHTQPLGQLEWIILIGFGILNIVAIETAKWLFHQKHPNKS